MINCPYLEQILNKTKLTMRDRKFIADSSCHIFQENTHLVCCRNEKEENESIGMRSSIKADTVKLPVPPVCGIEYQDNIYGGTKTKIDEHPWAALLIYKNLNILNHYCGGSLISSRYVLTGK